MPQYRIAIQVVYSHAIFLADKMGLSTTPRAIRYGGRVLQLALPAPPFPALTWPGGTACGWGVTILEDGKPWLCDCHPSPVSLTRTQAKELLAALDGKPATLVDAKPDAEEGWAWVEVGGQWYLLPIAPLRSILSYGIAHIGGQ